MNLLHQSSPSEDWSSQKSRECLNWKKKGWRPVVFARCKGQSENQSHFYPILPALLKPEHQKGNMKGNGSTSTINRLRSAKGSTNYSVKMCQIQICEGALRQHPVKVWKVESWARRLLRKHKTIKITKFQKLSILQIFVDSEWTPWEVENWVRHQ